MKDILLLRGLLLIAKGIRLIVIQIHRGDTGTGVDIDRFNNAVDEYEEEIYK